MAAIAAIMVAILAAIFNMVVKTHNNNLIGFYKIKRI
jgi:hypothetical protein